MKKAIILLFLMIPGIGAFAQSGQEIFDQAMTIQDVDPDQARLQFQAAALSWEEDLDTSEVPGYLYYNIGNAWFNSGDTGRAILNYLRAEEYLGHDSRLQHNLELARSRISEVNEENSLDSVLRILLFWHYIPFFWKLVLGSVFLALFWIGLIIRVTTKRMYPSLIIPSVCLAIVLLISSGIEYYTQSVQVKGVIIQNSVSLKKGDHSGYEDVLTEKLSPGTELILLETREGWIRIRLSGAIEGWLPETAVELVSKGG